jgi:hypothetical protein
MRHDDPGGSRGGFMNGESRWLLVPLCFALSLFVAATVLTVPWIFKRMHDPYGQGQVMAFSMISAWHCAWRGIVALVLTVPFAISDPVLDRRQVFLLASAAAVGVLAVGYVLETIAGVGLGYVPHLLVMSVVYASTLAVGRRIVDRRRR